MPRNRQAAHQGGEPPNHADPHRGFWEQRRIMMRMMHEHDKKTVDSIRRFDQCSTLTFILFMIAVFLLLARCFLDSGAMSRHALLESLLCEHSAGTTASWGAVPNPSGVDFHCPSTQSLNQAPTFFTALLPALWGASLLLAGFVAAYAIFLLPSHQLGWRHTAPWPFHPAGAAAVSFVVKTATILVLLRMLLTQQG